MKQKPKLLILEPMTFSEDARETLESVYSVSDYIGIPVPDVEVILAGLDYRLNKEFLRDFTSVGLLASLTTGRTHIDVDYLLSREIRLVTLNDFRDQIDSVSSTAELALALILSVGRRVSQSMINVIDGGYWRRMPFFTPELKGQTLGIVGFGRIGKTLAPMAQAVGFEVIAVDADVPVPSAFRRSALQELLEESDIISIHADFRGSVLLGEKQISECKKGAIIVNTARGELVDEVAISRAIRSGRLAGYAADVLVGENTELWNVLDDSFVGLAKQGHNVVLTPHLGGCTHEAFKATQIAMAAYLRNISADLTPTW